MVLSEEVDEKYITTKNIDSILKSLEKQMKEAADNLDFESATLFRDRIRDINSMYSKNSAIKSVPKSKKKLKGTRYKI